jgi:thiol-disulfide isomerase/thioredoxin
LNLNLDIINLSTHMLTESEQNILLKGLSFIPCENNTNFQHSLQQDIHNFHRKVLLYKYFKDKQDKHRELFIERSTWCPKCDSLEPQLYMYFLLIFTPYA